MKITQKIGQLGNTLEKTTKTVERVGSGPTTSIKKYPTLFLLLVTAGVVLIFFGFEKSFEKITFFAKYPYVMILIGIIILVFTGTLYKKLGKE